MMREDCGKGLFTDWMMQTADNRHRISTPSRAVHRHWRSSETMSMRTHLSFIVMPSWRHVGLLPSPNTVVANMECTCGGHQQRVFLQILYYAREVDNDPGTIRSALTSTPIAATTVHWSSCRRRCLYLCALMLGHAPHVRLSYLAAMCNYNFFF
jgi:hypothetical protein